ncbi:MAG: PilZ domain-containing protein [Clostridia bacterium]|nr:PilZ domain-containing protein [Clostridia bacterium]
MLAIEPGSVLSIRHYSGVNPFKSILMEQNEETLSVKLTKDFAIMNFLEGDPVVLGFELGNQVYILGCDILKIHAKENYIILKIDKIDSDANKRLYERFPVSIYADVRSRDNKKKCLVTIKDISYYGMMIYSKCEFRASEELFFDIYMDKIMLFLKCAIVRRAERQNFFEYGIRIMYEDVNSMNFMKEYLKRLKEEQDESIRKLKNI